MTDISDRPSIALRVRRAASTRRTWDPVLWAIVAAVFAADAALPVARYLTGNPGSWDLGIFTEAVSRYAHLQAPVVPIKHMNLLGDHFSPVIALLAPFFRLFPSPVTLLVGQAVLVAGSVIPVHRAARHVLPASEARLIAASYGLSWGLVNMVWFDFHEVAFAVPLLAASMSAAVRGRWRACVWWAVPLVWVKEDQGFTVAAVGVVLAVVYRRRLGGLLLAAWGVGWSLLATCLIIPGLNAGHTYPYWKDGLHLDALADGWEVKAPTIALMLLVTSGLALRSPLATVAAPALALRIISSNPVYWDMGWHYSATAMPILFVAAADGLRRIRAARIDGTATPLGLWLGSHGSAVVAAVAVAFAFQSPISQLWQPALYRTPRSVQVAARIERLIPDGATVATGLAELAPLAARTRACFWKCAVPPQWILIDQAPAAMLGMYPKARYRVVVHRGGVWLLRQAG